MDAVGRRAVESAAAAVGDRRTCLGDKSLGPLDRRDDGRGRFDDGSGEAVDLFGGEDGGCAGEKPGVGLVAVVRTDGDLLIEGSASLSVLARISDSSRTIDNTR